MLALDAGRPAQLEAAWRALDSLPLSDQLSLGFAHSKDGECHAASYRQVSDTFSVLCRGIDPTPVPSFRGVPDKERVLHLAAARRGVDAEANAARLDAVSDALVEASVPARLQKRLYVAGGRLDRSRDLEPAPAARGPPAGQ